MCTTHMHTHTHAHGFMACQHQHEGAQEPDCPWPGPSSAASPPVACLSPSPPFSWFPASLSLCLFYSLRFGFSCSASVSITFHCLLLCPSPCPLLCFLDLSPSALSLSNFCPATSYLIPQPPAPGDTVLAQGGSLETRVQGEGWERKKFLRVLVLVGNSRWIVIQYEEVRGCPGKRRLKAVEQTLKKSKDLGCPLRVV